MHTKYTGTARMFTFNIHQEESGGRALFVATAFRVLDGLHHHLIGCKKCYVACQPAVRIMAKPITVSTGCWSIGRLARGF